jgi:hypothetical protein
LDVYTRSTTTLTNNTKVAVWDDISNNQLDLQQPAVANQPTYYTNGFNFNPAVFYSTATTTTNNPDFGYRYRYLITAPTLNGIPVLTIQSTAGTQTNPTGIMELGEIIAYKTIPTTGQQNIIETYLATKYGITLNKNYVAGDSVTKIFDTALNRGYVSNIFGIGRSDCQTLHQRESKSVNLEGLITIGNNNIIDTVNGNSSISGNDIATNNSYLYLGDNGGPLEVNVNLFNGKYLINRIWKLQETGTIGSVKISVPAFGNKTSSVTLPDISGPILFYGDTLYLLMDDDGNFFNGGTTYVPMNKVGGGATLAYEVNVDLLNAKPFLRFAVSQNIADTDGDGVINVIDNDDDNDGISDVVESPACFVKTAEWNSIPKTLFVNISSQLNSTYPTNNFAALTDNIGGAVDAVLLTAAQAQLNKELFRLTFASPMQLDAIYIQKSSATQIFSATASTLMLQGTNDTTSWTNLLTAAIASPANATNATINGGVSLANSNVFTVATNAAKYKYYRIFGVAAGTTVGGVASEFYFDVNNATYLASAYPKATCKIGRAHV